MKRARWGVGLAAALLLVLIGSAAAFWWQGGIDAAVKRALDHYGTEMTQARVQVGGVRINPLDGLGEITQLVVGNPPGFKTPHAAVVQRIEVQVDVRTLAQPVLVIRKIVVVAPEVTYEKGAAQTNFDALQKNIAAYLAAARPAPGSTDHAAESPPKKLIVEELVLRNVRARASADFFKGEPVAVTLPDIHLRNIGSAQGGVMPGELGAVVTGALRQRLLASLSFESLRLSLDKQLGEAGSHVRGWFR